MNRIALTQRSGISGRQSRSDADNTRHGHGTPLGMLTVAGGAIALFLLARLAANFFIDEFGSTLLDEIFVAITAIFAPVGFFLVVRHRGTNKFVLLLLGYLAALVVGGYVSGYSSQFGLRQIALGLVLELKLFILLFAFVALFSYERNPRRALQLILWTLIVIALVNSLAALLDMVRGISIFGEPLKARGPFSQPKGLFHHQILSAQVSMTGFIAAAAHAMLRRDPRWIALAAYLLVITLLHVATKEAASAIAFLCGAYLLTTGGRAGSAVFGLAAIGLVLGMVMMSPLGDTFIGHIDRYASEGAEASVRGRLYNASWQIARDFFPLGSGTSTFASQGSRQFGIGSLYFDYNVFGIWGANYANSNFLLDVFWPKILAESGVLGLLAFASLICGLLVVGYRLTRRHLTPEHLAMLGIMSAVLLTSIAAPTLSSDYLGVLFYVFGAYALAIAIRRDEGQARRMTARPVPAVRSNGR